jgi:Asp-tRNA(Asn)/Glu-tRNA(Gln) amidotransferase C subunit
MLDVDRVARLARLRLTPEESARIAPALEAIAREFSTLADRAASLPEPPAERAGEPRADVVAPAPAEEVEGILRAGAPRVDRERFFVTRGA